jgi:hypothetical protein
MDKDKLIAKLEELIAHIRVMPDRPDTLLDVEFKAKWIQKNISLESEIASLKDEIEKEKLIQRVNDASDKFNEAKLKEELVKFYKWNDNEFPDEYLDANADGIINEYLKQRNNG